jgi:hypothetical protein
LKYNTPNKGAPPKAIAKPRKPSRILQTLQSNSHNETNSFALEKRNTKRARKNIRNTKVCFYYFTIMLLFILTNKLDSGTNQRRNCS